MDIIYEDNHLLVVNKPAGISTQDTQTSNESLESDAKAWIKEKYQKPGAVFLHAVHRLDKPVSGVVVFARTSKALSRLNEEVRLKKNKKHYLALVEGTSIEDKGTLEHYLFHAEHRAMLSNSKEGQRARLRYQVIQRFKTESVVSIELDTGRYHQIRAQFSFSGYPILGDKKYGSKRSFKEGAIALHHLCFKITHPISKELMVFKAPCPFLAHCFHPGLD
ncbi:MAG: RluA family pseudouridine synthase [Parachlamydiaceae bacterium]